MATAHDVAAEIVAICGSMSAMKLQKLVYYSQAWALVWDDEPIFLEKIEAWANGPVVVELYERHKGQFTISSWTDGNGDNLQRKFRETIKAVCTHYGKFNAQQLSDLTHSEEPWIQAREGLAPGERGNHEITLASMSEYYSGL